MMVHPVQALRSAGSGSPTTCSARTTPRGHPLWRLARQLHSTPLHLATQLPALSLESATSVARQVTTLVSVPRTSIKFRTLHPVPEVTTLVAASHLRRSSPPSHRLP